MNEIRVCYIDDIDDPGARGIDLPDADWPSSGFVIRKGDEVFAYRNTCPHAGNPLHWKPDGFLTKSRDLIMCSKHGAIFEISTGVCVAGPCPGKSLTALRVRIENGRDFVRI